MHIAKLSYWFSGVFVLLCKTICGWECVYKTQSEDQSRIFCVLDWGVRGPDAKTQLTFWEKLPLLYIVRREIAIKLTWHSMHKSHTHTHTRQWASHRRRGVRECVRVCVCVWASCIRHLSHEDGISFLSGMWCWTQKLVITPKLRQQESPIKDAGQEVHELRPLSVQPPTYYPSYTSLWGLRCHISSESAHKQTTHMKGNQTLTQALWQQVL